MYIRSYIARDAADLAQAVAASTKWIPCFCARQVIFEWRATSAATLQNHANPLEGNNADPLIAGIAIGSGIGTTPSNVGTLNPNVAGAVLNGATGGIRCAIGPAGPAGVGAITVKALRMNVTGPAAGNITGLSCIAYVIYDDEDMTGIGEVAV